MESALLIHSVVRCLVDSIFEHSFSLGASVEAFVDCDWSLSLLARFTFSPLQCLFFVKCSIEPLGRSVAKQTGDR